MLYNIYLYDTYILCSSKSKYIHSHDDTPYTVAPPCEYKFTQLHYTMAHWGHGTPNGFFFSSREVDL